MKTPTTYADSGGYSRIEVVCIAGISLFAIALVLALGWFMLNLMWQGDDANTMNTAQSVGNVHTSSACLVPDCPGGSASQHAQHLTDNGACRAFYDKGTNSLTGARPAGYNESFELTINNLKTAVQPNTMVIQVTCKDGDVVCSWVEGS